MVLTMLELTNGIGLHKAVALSLQVELLLARVAG